MLSVCLLQYATIHVSLTGVVVGVLTPERRIDTERMRLLRLASAPLSLTFHRAFDVMDLAPPSPSPSSSHSSLSLSCSHSSLHSSALEGALQQLLDLGCDRLLTSGMAQHASSAEGIACLKRLVDCAARLSPPSLRIVAASGVSSQNAAHLVAVTGVHGVHAGSSVTAVVRLGADEGSGSGSDGGSGSSSDSSSSGTGSGGVSDFDLRHIVSVERVEELVNVLSFTNDVL
jgi:copper homeostasis protein CutC